jgi:proline iminopeptidase
LLFPLSDEQNKPRQVKGRKYWDLPSGSKIAYVYLPGNGKSNLPPVLFLHGGPGVPDMAGDSSYFGKLTQAGYDVYIYDEVGSGLSSRLEDPSAYTIQRDVIDLESIRKKIETDRMILIGHSYGSEVVANYMASYDGTVEKAVFISPGGINPEDTSGGNLISRLSISERLHLFSSLLHPRVMMAYSLLQVNPLAAINYAGDDEMDARFDIVYKKSQASLHAKDKPVGPQLSGLGFYAHQTPQSAAAEPKIDIRESLSEKDTPALIVKGSGDYLSWSSAIDYKKALHNSRLVYFKNAGHNVYQDQPDLFMKVMKAFLADRTLPVEAYSDTAPPKDYEGVP